MLWVLMHHHNTAEVWMVSEVIQKRISSAQLLFAQARAQKTNTVNLSNKTIKLYYFQVQSTCLHYIIQQRNLNLLFKKSVLLSILS